MAVYLSKMAATMVGSSFSGGNDKIKSVAKLWQRLNLCRRQPQHSFV